MKIIRLFKYLLGFLALKLCLAIAWASALAIMQPQLILHTSPITQATIWTFFVLIPISAILEEGAFRYAVWRILKRLGNKRLFVFLLVSSVISALAHLTNVQYAGTLGMACYFLIQFASSLYHSTRTPMKVTKLSNVRLLSTDLKGYTVTFVYKDGIRQEVPILAKSHQEALQGACFIIDHDKDKIHNLDDVDQVRIVDPTIGEVLRAVGVGAKRAIGIAKEAAGKVVEKAKEVAPMVGVAAKKAITIAKEVTPKVAVGIRKIPYAVGRLRALPEELRQELRREYERGRFERVRVERPTPRWDKREILRLVDMTKSGDVSVRVMARAYLRKFYPEVYSELIKEAKVGR